MADTKQVKCLGCSALLMLTPEKLREDPDIEDKYVCKICAKNLGHKNE